MSDNSHIEWTDATWNPTVGCTKVSAGCDHCYAETLVNRFAGTSAAFPTQFDQVTIRSEKFLTQPLRWRRPRRIFVNSLSDLFHKDVPDEFIAEVFAVMAGTPQHTYQLLTKRHGRMRALLRSGEFRALVEDAAVERIGLAGVPWPLPNLWVGVSVEDQASADLRIPALLETPAVVRWISAEPLLGPIRLHRRHAWCPTHDFDGGFCVGPCPDRYTFDWVVVGGESGPGARPMRSDWALAIRDECQRIGVPFLFKQWGAWAPTTQVGVGAIDDPNMRYGEVVYDDRRPDVRWYRLYRRVGKRAAGRQLDGRTWDEYPQTRQVVTA